MIAMFHWIEVRAFCHATEEEERVVAALRTVMREGEFRREKLEGHFGNPLLVLKARAEGAQAMAVWSRLVAVIGKDEALGDLEERLDDEGVYHLRIDKQKAFLGEIGKASSEDVISLRAKVAAFPNRRDVAVEVLRRSVEAV